MRQSRKAWMAMGLGLQMQRLRLLRTRRRRPWLSVERPTDGRTGTSVVTTDHSPSLSRLARIQLDLAFRTRGEAALVRVAYHGNAVARTAGQGGGLLLMAACATTTLLPLLGGLLGLGGLVALSLAALAKTAALLANLPASATRALHLQRWSTPSARAAASRDGDRVRVRGRISALRTVPALDGRPAVFVRVRATRKGRGTDLQKAEDFLLDDGTGVPTRVQVAHALFLDRPVRLLGSWNSPPLETFTWIPSGTRPVDLDEAALFQGDEVEVVGRSEMVVDPSIADRLARATPLVRVLSGTPDEPLLLKSVL